MKQPCYVPSKNYKVRVIAKNKVLNKLNIKTIVSISSSVIAARGASRGPRRVALIGRSPFLFFSLFLTDGCHDFYTCLKGLPQCCSPLPLSSLLSSFFSSFSCSPHIPFVSLLSPRDASGAIFHFSGETGIMEASATVCLIKE